jgi:SAM-dependent methyltransferase
MMTARIAVRRMNRFRNVAVTMVARGVIALVTIALTASVAGAHGGEAGRDRFQNPRDLDGYIAAQEEPARAAWQKPDQVLDTLAPRAGQTVCDIGAGPGYFALRIAKRVGATGRVFAVDVEPRILDALRTRIEAARLRNITPVLALGTDPLLPAASCDLVLIVDVYHHFADRAQYLRGLVRLLRPGGRLAAIDWHKRKTAIGPPPEHRVSREEFLADAAKAGLRLVAEPTFLPNQYFVILAPVIVSPEIGPATAPAPR